MQPGRHPAGQQELHRPGLVPAPAASGFDAAPALSDAPYRSDPVAGLGRSTGMDCTATRPQQHRDAVQGLQPLCAKSDPARWIGHGAAAGQPAVHRRPGSGAGSRAGRGWWDDRVTHPGRDDLCASRGSAAAADTETTRDLWCPNKCQSSCQFQFDNPVFTPCG